MKQGINYIITNESMLRVVNKNVSHEVVIFENLKKTLLQFSFMDTIVEWFIWLYYIFLRSISYQ